MAAEKGNGEATREMERMRQEMEVMRSRLASHEAAGMMGDSVADAGEVARLKAIIKDFEREATDPAREPSADSLVGSVRNRKDAGARDLEVEKRLFELEVSATRSNLDSEHRALLKERERLSEMACALRVNRSAVHGDPN